MEVPATASEGTRRCSWCHLPQDRVAFLIASPTEPRVYICDECIEVCHSVLEERRGKAVGEGEISPQAKSELLSPIAQIKQGIEASEKLSK